MAQTPEDDEYMRRYLQAVDLQHLDLNNIDLDSEAQAENAAPWGKLLGFVAVAGLMLWLPNSTYYQLHNQATWLLWSLAAVGLWLGMGTGRWLWEQGLAAQARAANLPRPQTPQMPLLPPAVVRWLMLFTAIGLAAVLYFALPHDAVWMGNGYSADWFWGVGVALAVGILLGRWLIAQAAAAPAPRDVKPIKLPPWFKWANLAMLGVAALFALFGNHLFNQETDAVGFGMSGVGLFVGIFGAIWLSRRFDEMEARLTARTRNQAGQAGFKIGENR